MEFSDFPLEMTVEELQSALSTGEYTEPIESWATRVAAVLITITLHNPTIIEENPEAITNYLRIVTSKMPTEVMLAAAMGLAQINEIASEPGMTPELYHEVQDAFKDFEGGSEGQ